MPASPDSGRDSVRAITDEQHRIGQQLWDDFGATDPILVEDAPDIRALARATSAFFLELVKTGMEYQDVYIVTDSYLTNLMFSEDHPHLHDD